MICASLTKLFKIQKTVDKIKYICYNKIAERQKITEKKEGKKWKIQA